jgi:hypothetical protein
MAASAADLAKQFDARNGNSFFSDYVQTLAQELD